MPRNVYAEINLHITWHTKDNASVLVDIVEDRVMASEAWVSALTGKTREARDLLTQLEERSRSGVDLGAFIALVRHALGDDEAALTRLEKVVHEHGSLSMFFPLQTEWKRLHSHPRYQAILRKVNLLK